MFQSGLASPVTLAPKSARAIGPNEFPPDMLAAFASSAQTIDLTMDNDGSSMKVGMDNVGSTADKPIELDLEGMDIDMTMTDLFGDTADTVSNDVNATMEGLFSPIVMEPEANQDNNTGKSIKTEGPFLEALGQSNHEDDIFSSLDVQSQQSKDTSSVTRSAPSPASLIASFETASQLQAMDPMSSSTVPVSEAPFDIGALDLSHLTHLSPSFFGTASETDMSFSMDMDHFMATVNEGKEDAMGKKMDAS